MIIKFNQQSPTLDKNNHSSCQFKGTTRTFNCLKSEFSDELRRYTARGEKLLNPSLMRRCRKKEFHHRLSTGALCLCTACSNDSLRSNLVQETNVQEVSALMMMSSYIIKTICKCFTNWGNSDVCSLKLEQLEKSANILIHELQS